MGRELVSTGFISLDGVVDSPGGKVEGHRSGGWVFDTPFVPEAFALKGDEMAETSALMFGRHSNEMFAPVWRGSELAEPPVWKPQPPSVFTGQKESHCRQQHGRPFVIFESIGIDIDHIAARHHRQPPRGQNSRITFRRVEQPSQGSRYAGGDEDDLPPR